MTTKPPSGSSEAIDDGIEDSIDDSLDELVLRAKEAALENPVKPAIGSHEASRPMNGSDGPAAEIAKATMSDNSAEIALDIAEVDDDEVDQALAAGLPGSAVETGGEGDAGLIPIPDVISADSPDNVPRGGVAGDVGEAALPVAERDVVVSEDEVRVKVEHVPGDDAAATLRPGDADESPAPKDEPAPAAGYDPSPVVEASAGAASAPDDGKLTDEGGEAAEAAEGEAGSDDTTANMRAGELRPAVTPVAGHPLLADEAMEESTPVEELTPVEPYANAMRAAGMSEAGLATQAKEERDRALRESSGTPGSRTPPTTASHPVPAANVDFDDSENELKLDDDTETETPSDLRRLSPSRDQQGARGPTPPQGYPGRRLPTPSPGILQGPKLGSGAYPTLSTSPGLMRMTPSKTISGVKSPSLSSAIFNTVRLPLGGLLAVLGAAFGGGLLIGAVLWRAAPGDMGSAAHEQPPAQSAEVVAAPVAQPPAAAPVAPAPPAPAAAPAAAVPVAEAPAAATAAAAAPADAPTHVAPVVQAQPPTAGRPTRPGVATAAAGKSVVRPKRTASASGGKSKTTWVDPFAQ